MFIHRNSILDVLAAVWKECVCDMWYTYTCTYTYTQTATAIHVCMITHRYPIKDVHARSSRTMSAKHDTHTHTHTRTSTNQYTWLFLQASNTRCACSGIEGMSPGNMIHIHIRTHEPAPIIHDYLQAPILDVHAVVLKEWVREIWCTSTYAHMYKHQPLYMYVCVYTGTQY